MGIKRSKTVNRRDFLKGSASLGAAALTGCLWRNAATQEQVAGPTPEPPPPPDGAVVGELDNHIYLPLVSHQKPLAQGGSKLGLHTLRANSAESFVRDVHDAGAHVALVKALDEFGYLRQVKTISPETVTVARSNIVTYVEPNGNPADAAAWLMDQHMPKWQWEWDVVDYWEIQNENDPPTIAGHVWLAEMYIAAMQIAEDYGHKLAIFSYSTGVPQWHEWEAIVETGSLREPKRGDTSWRCTSTAGRRPITAGAKPPKTCPLTRIKES